MKTLEPDIRILDQAISCLGLGITTASGREVRDMARLGLEYIKRKAKANLESGKKPYFSVMHSYHPKSKLYERFIGEQTESDAAAPGLLLYQIPVGTYAVVVLTPRRFTGWIGAVKKAREELVKCWLPESGWEQRSGGIVDFERHGVVNPGRPEIEFWLAVQKRESQ